MASFSILIGAGRILVQESLVMSQKKKKKKCTFDFSSQDGVSLYGLGCPEL